MTWWHDDKIINDQSIDVSTYDYNFIVQCGAPQLIPRWGESSGVAPGVGIGEEKLRAGQSARVVTTGNQVHLHIIIIIIIIMTTQCMVTRALLIPIFLWAKNPVRMLQF